MSNEIGMSVKDFLDYVAQSKSKATLRLYKRGLTVFSEWYGKSLEEILEERKQDWVSNNLMQKKRFTREIEKFHKWMVDKGYSINTATSFCNGILQMFRFFEMPVTLPTGSNVSKIVVSTKDFVPTSKQYQEMYKKADSLRDKLIISMGKDLGWRVGDFIKQQKDQMPNLEADPPIGYSLITEKEDVIAKSFLSAETVELLKEYLPTLPEDNPYLFPSGNGKKGKSIGDETVTRALRQLAEKAKIKIPKRKRLRFHAFRKRFLSTCANLGIDVNIAKILVGKNVELSMLTYLSEVEHRRAFLEVQDVLRLTELPTQKTAKPASELEKELEDLKRLVYGMYALGYRREVEEAKRRLKIENLPLYVTEEERAPRRIGTPLATEAYTHRKLSIEEIKEIGKKELEKQKEEYRRIIEENNNH